MLRKLAKFILSLVFLSLPFQARANNMAVFLKSCAFGTAAGATLGLATVALSENPSERLNTIARGASLGLYAGIGYGLYVINNPSVGQRDFSQIQSPVWISTLFHQNRLEGAQINWAQFSF